MSKDEIIDSFTIADTITNKPPQNYGLTKGNQPESYGQNNKGALINQRNDLESQLTNLKNNKPEDREDRKGWKEEQNNIRKDIKKLNIKIKELGE